MKVYDHTACSNLKMSNNRTPSKSSTYAEQFCATMQHFAGRSAHAFNYAKLENKSTKQVQIFAKSSNCVTVSLKQSLTKAAAGAINS